MSRSLTLGLALAAAGVASAAAGQPTLQPLRQTARSDPRAAASGSPEQRVLEAYYGNTLVCGAVVTGQDLCHTWMERDGSFINFDPGGVRRGRFTIGPMRPDGKVPVCYYWDSAATPRPLSWPSPPQPHGQTVTTCATRDFYTVCSKILASAAPPEVAHEDFFAGMGRRWHAGMCYPLQARHAGESWIETDDPLPAQAGVDRVTLVAGHR